MSVDQKEALEEGLEAFGADPDDADESEDEDEDTNEDGAGGDDDGLPAKADHDGLQPRQIMPTMTLAMPAGMISIGNIVLWGQFYPPRPPGPNRV